MNINDYHLRMQSISNSVNKLVGTLIKAHMTVSADKDEVATVLKPTLLQVVRNGRVDSYTAATQFLQSEAARQGVDGDVYVPSLSGYPDKSVDTVLRKYLVKDPQVSANQIAPILAQHSVSAGREVITRAVEDGTDTSDSESTGFNLSKEAFEQLKQEDATEEAPKRVSKQLKKRDEGPLDKINKYTPNSDVKELPKLEDLEAEPVNNDSADNTKSSKNKDKKSKKGKKGKKNKDKSDTDVPEAIKNEAKVPNAPVATMAKGKNPNGAKPKAWARILTGKENCGFCVILASRGPVYRSKENAGYKKDATGKLDDGLGPYVNSYHKGCDCAVVPIYNFKDWPGKSDLPALRRLYKETVVDAKWKDEDGNEHKGLGVGRGPSKRAKNQALAAVNRKLSDLEAAGTPLSDKLSTIDLHNK